MRTEFQTIMRTGKLHQLYAADLALTQVGVPHNLQEESSSGLRTAMPADPSPAPGTWWAILVPLDQIAKSEEILGSLPFDVTTHPDVWDCNLTFQRNRLIKIAIWVAIISIVVAMILAVAGA